MQTTMNAIGFRRYGLADVLERLEVPQPTIAPDGVLVRIAAAGINPADWNLRSGALQMMAPLKMPFVPGSDIAGRVEAVGSAVTRFKSGDAVYAMLPTIEGGGYAQFAIVAERNVALKPANLSFAEAAAVPLAALTALQALRDTADLRTGQGVLINGASGGVGTFAVQIARVLGARTTAACGTSNVELVRSLGADEVLDYTQGDLTQSEKRFDVVFDAVGVRPLTDWQQLLTPAGTAVTVNPMFAMALQGMQPPAHQRLTSMFVQPNGDDLTLVTRWIEGGQVHPAIDRLYALEQAVEAHLYSESKRVRGKLVLIVDEALKTTT